MKIKLLENEACSARTMRLIVVATCLLVFVFAVGKLLAQPYPAYPYYPHQMWRPPLVSHQLQPFTYAYPPARGLTILTLPPPHPEWVLRGLMIDPEKQKELEEERRQKRLEENPFYEVIKRHLEAEAAKKDQDEAATP